MSQSLPSHDGKTTLTIMKAYQYEQNMGRIGRLSFKGFCTRADNGVYPFYIVPGKGLFFFVSPAKAGV